MANIESHLREVADAIEVRFASTAQILLVARPYLFWVWLRHLRHRVFSLHIQLDSAVVPVSGQVLRLAQRNLNTMILPGTLSLVYPPIMSSNGAVGTTLFHLSRKQYPSSALRQPT